MRTLLYTIGEKMKKTETIEYIRWEKRFELGIPYLDAQHHQLVAICNELYQTIVINKSRTDTPSWQQSLSIAIRKTVEYIKKHFTDEENLMTIISYKDFPAHKARHQEFIIKVSDLLVMFDYLAYQDAMDFIKFLYTWTLEHIAVEDKQFVPAVFKYLQEQQVKLTTVMFSAVYQNRDFSAV